MTDTTTNLVAAMPDRCNQCRMLCEERHVETRDALSRAFNEVSEVKREVSSIRIQVERLNGEVVPLKESRQWMMAGLLGVVALVGAAVIGLVLIQR
ncbi:MAG: hypothetical protein KDK91_01620 [Gammaproteobacteria bacterium]|nr:hypothetical protein [Gammaproteobacteria bacterium]